MPRIILFMLCLALAWTAVGGEVHQRYVTTWEPSPIARLAIDDAIEFTGVRCRLKLGEDEWGEWWHGRQITYTREPAPQAWQLPLENLTPGNYDVQHDIRTPLGADYREGRLRVPVVARFASQPIVADGDLSEWPQARYGTVNQDWPDLWVAWDRNGLYFGVPSTATEPVRVALQLLPAKETLVFELDVRNLEIMMPWENGGPAGPHLGQVLRISRVGKDSEGIDLLFVGSGLEMYWGTTWVSGDPGHDDQGPPKEVLRGLEDRIPGINLRFGGTSWQNLQPSPDAEPDWKRLRRQKSFSYDGLIAAGIDTWNEWAMELEKEDPERYEELVREYVDEYIRQISDLGIEYFNCGFNEPELFHVTDRENFFLDDLNRSVDRIRLAAPDAKVIAGKFSSGNANVVRSFILAGFQDNFDVLDIHPYSNDPRTGCFMGGVVASHEVLREFDMGHKRIYLGEGWGPTRNLPQVNRPGHDHDVSEREADLMRQYYWNGYRSLTTPRDDYNPEWVLGAKFFTLNDNISSTYWRVNARPHYNAEGEIEYYLLSHLAFSNLEDMNPGFWNGGLVDFYGEPKGQWLFDFPPSLPDVRLRVTMDGNYLLRGRPMPLRVRLVNAEAEPITDLALGIRHRTSGFEDGSVGNLDEITGLPDSLDAGADAQAGIMALVEGGNQGPLRVAVELDFTWRGTRYVVDEVIRTELRDDVTVKLDPSRIDLSMNSNAAKGRVSLRNNTHEVVEGALLGSLPQGILAKSQPMHVGLSPGEVVHYGVEIEASRAPAGLYTLPIAFGEHQGMMIARPLMCRHLAQAPVIDGDLSDWPERDPMKETVNFRGAVGLDTLDLNVPFPVPTPQETGRLPRAIDDQPVQADLDGHAVTGWTDDGLYLGVVVKDEVHHQRWDGMDVWRADSIQIAIDPERTGPPGRAATLAEQDTLSYEEGFNAGHYELTLALTPKGPQVSVVRGPQGEPTGVISQAELEVVYKDGFAVYEAFLPWSMFTGLSPDTRRDFSMDMLINDSDGGDRYTLGWADAIADGKFPSRYVPVYLVE